MNNIIKDLKSNSNSGIGTNTFSEKFDEKSLKLKDLELTNQLLKIQSINIDEEG
jgi:hypothetical protein